MMTDNDVYIPQAGETLEGPGLELILNAVERRQKNFPDEPLKVTLALILMNIGDRFTPLRCTEGEWKGYKWDISSSNDGLTCPNGHSIEKERTIALGWVPDTE